MSDAAEAIVQSLILLAAVLAVTAIGIALVRKLRDRTGRDEPSSHEIMTNFRELHARGGLSDEEYSTIKSKLAGRVKSEFESSRPSPSESAEAPDDESSLDAEIGRVSALDPTNPLSPLYNSQQR